MAEKSVSDETKQRYSYWRKRVFFTLWITYGTFYLTRVNMSIAIPGLMDEFGLTKTMMGGVLSALFIMYAIGQFVNGQLGDKFGAKKLITLGLVVSALINIAFGFTNGILIGMMLLWGLNGFFQAMGWSPTVKTLANWFPTKMRSKRAGLLGTSYQIGSAYSWALSGFVVGLLGWRWAFFIPAIVVLFSALHFFLRIKNAPEEVGLPTLEEEEDGIERSKAERDQHLGFRFTLSTVLKNKSIWIVAFSLFFLNIIRYGFLVWAPTYLFEVQKATISIAAYKAMAIPIAGCFGAVFAGWVSHRVFSHRKAPVTVIMLLLLALFSFAYPLVPAGDWVLSLVVLIMIGFLTYGPHVMIVTALPMDLGTRKAAASATGFIDGMGYIGAAFTGIGTGFLIDSFGWNAAFYFWVASAIVTALLMLLLWNFKPSREKYH